MTSMSTDGVYEVVFSAEGMPEDITRAATQAFMTKRHGRFVGIDVLGVLWSGFVEAETQDAISVDLTFDARGAQPDAVVFDVDGARTRGPIQHKLVLRKLEIGDRVDLECDLVAGPITYRAKMLRIGRFDGPEI